MDKRGEYQDFLWKISCPTVPRIFVGGIVQCFINSGYRKSLDKRRVGREYQDSPSKFFCLTVPKISAGGTL